MIGRERVTRYLQFAAAGTLGFLVDAGVLALLLAFTPVGPFLARLVSIPCALAATFLFNRHITFEPSDRGALAEGARYGLVGAGTALANYLVYSGLLIAMPALPPHAALVISSLTGMVLSYLGYSRLVFGT